MLSRAGSCEMEQIQPHQQYNHSSLYTHKQRVVQADLSPLTTWVLSCSEWAPTHFDVLPCVDEVLSDTDAGRRACDRDLARS